MTQPSNIEWTEHTWNPTRGCSRISHGCGGASGEGGCYAERMAMSPNLRDVWIKDGALLDDESLELVEAMATEKGYRVWLERVGEGDVGAIVIEDGAVRGAVEEDAA